jgi:maltodextrin utilization protein YvdJ
MAISYTHIEVQHLNQLVENQWDTVSDNVILSIENVEISEGEISLLTSIAAQLEAKSRSFVVVAPNLSYEALPERVNFCPTFEEAIDCIEFEEIQRDLAE